MIKSVGFGVRVLVFESQRLLVTLDEIITLQFSPTCIKGIMLIPNS